MDFFVEKKKIKREREEMRKETMTLFGCKYINLRETFRDLHTLLFASMRR